MNPQQRPQPTPATPPPPREAWSDRKQRVEELERRLDEERARLEADRAAEEDRDREEQRRRSKQLEEQADEARRRVEQLRKAAADEQRRADEHLKEEQEAADLIGELEGEADLNQAVVVRLELDDLVGERAALELALRDRQTQLESISDERRKREDRGEAALLALLRRAELLEHELANGEYDRRARARLATRFADAGDGLAGPGTRVIDEVLAQQRARFEAQLLEQEATVRQLNERRMSLAQQRAAFRRRRRLARALAQKGADVLEELELGHAPPQHFLARNPASDAVENGGDGGDDDDEAGNSSADEDAAGPACGARIVDETAARLARLREEHARTLAELPVPYAGELGPDSYPPHQRPLYYMMRELLTEKILPPLVALAVASGAGPDSADLERRAARMREAAEAKERRRQHQAAEPGRDSKRVCADLLGEVVEEMAADVILELCNIESFARRASAQLLVAAIQDASSPMPPAQQPPPPRDPAEVATAARARVPTQLTWRLMQESATERTRTLLQSPELRFLHRNDVAVLRPLRDGEEVSRNMRARQQARDKRARARAKLRPEQRAEQADAEEADAEEEQLDLVAHRLDAAPEDPRSQAAAAAAGGTMVGVVVQRPMGPGDGFSPYLSDERALRLHFKGLLPHTAAYSAAETLYWTRVELGDPEPMSSSRAFESALAGRALPEGWNRAVGPATAAAFSPNGRWIAVGGRRGGVGLVRVRWFVPSPPPPASAPASSEPGPLDSSLRMCVWPASKGAAAPPASPAVSVVWNRSGTSLVSLHENGTVAVWRASEGRIELVPDRTVPAAQLRSGGPSSPGREGQTRSSKQPQGVASVRAVAFAPGMTISAAQPCLFVGLDTGKIVRWNPVNPHKLAGDIGSFSPPPTSAASSVVPRSGPAVVPTASPRSGSPARPPAGTDAAYSGLEAFHAHVEPIVLLRAVRPWSETAAETESLALLSVSRDGHACVWRREPGQLSARGCFVPLRRYSLAGAHSHEELGPLEEHPLSSCSSPSAPERVEAASLEALLESLGPGVRPWTGAGYGVAGEQLSMTRPAREEEGGVNANRSSSNSNNNSAGGGGEGAQESIARDNDTAKSEGIRRHRFVSADRCWVWDVEVAKDTGTAALLGRRRVAGASAASTSTGTFVDVDVSASGTDVVVLTRWPCPAPDDGDPGSVQAWVSHCRESPSADGLNAQVQSGADRGRDNDDDDDNNNNSGGAGDPHHRRNRLHQQQQHHCRVRLWSVLPRAPEGDKDHQAVLQAERESRAELLGRLQTPAAVRAEEGARDEASRVPSLVPTAVELVFELAADEVASVRATPCLSLPGSDYAVVLVHADPSPGSTSAAAADNSSAALWARVLVMSLATGRLVLHRRVALPRPRTAVSGAFPFSVGRLGEDGGLAVVVTVPGASAEPVVMEFRDCNGVHSRRQWLPFWASGLPLGRVGRPQRRRYCVEERVDMRTPAPPAPQHDDAEMRSVSTRLYRNRLGFGLLPGQSLEWMAKMLLRRGARDRARKVAAYERLVGAAREADERAQEEVPDYRRPNYSGGYPWVRIRRMVAGIVAYAVRTSQEASDARERQRQRQLQEQLQEQRVPRPPAVPRSAAAGRVDSQSRIGAAAATGTTAAANSGPGGAEGASRSARQLLAAQKADKLPGPGEVAGPSNPRSIPQGADQQ